jgi:hypothetical protein
MILAMCSKLAAMKQVFKEQLIWPGRAIVCRDRQIGARFVRAHGGRKIWHDLGQPDPHTALRQVAASSRSRYQRDMLIVRRIALLLAATTGLAAHSNGALADTRPCHSMEYERAAYTICKVDTSTRTCSHSKGIQPDRLCSTALTPLQASSARIVTPLSWRAPERTPRSVLAGGARKQAHCPWGPCQRAGSA